MYPSVKSWDEVPGKMSSRKKFFHNVISGADFTAQPYFVAMVVKTNSICTEGSYPYTATDGTCNLSGCQVGIPEGGVVDYTDVSTDSEEATMSAVTQQPVSIDIEIDQYSFQLYSSG